MVSCGHGQFGVQRWSVTAGHACCARKLAYHVMFGNVAHLLAVTMWVTLGHRSKSRCFTVHTQTCYQWLKCKIRGGGTLHLGLGP